MTARVTEDQKRSVVCPKCGRLVGENCRMLKTVRGFSGQTFPLLTAHDERRAAYLASLPRTGVIDIDVTATAAFNTSSNLCTSCGMLFDRHQPSCPQGRAP